MVFLSFSCACDAGRRSIKSIKYPIKKCWIAEAYEPYVLSLSNKTHQDFDYVQEENILPNDVEVNRMRRTLVGAINIDPHKALDNSGWINRFAVKSNYNFDKVAEPLIHRALKFGLDQSMYSIETVTTECQSSYRELLLKMGFSMRQIYHKQVLGSNSLRIMKSQMGVDLKNWAVEKNK